MRTTITLLAALTIGCAGGGAMYSFKMGEIEERIQRIEVARAEIESSSKQVQRRVEVAESTRIHRPPPAAIVGIDPVASGGGAPATKRVPPKRPDPNTIVSQLYRANMAFSVPGKVNIKDDIKVQLVVDPVKAADELAKTLEPGTVVDYGSIRVSKIIKANLVAPDFKIDQVTPEVQPVAEEGTTEWNWNLKPLTPGLHPVKLSVWAEVKIGDKTVPYNMHTYDKQVMVEVTAAQTIAGWWSKYWQWTFTTLIIPFGIWLWKSKSAKKESTPTNHQ